MATLIPISGETQLLETPKTKDEIHRLLQIPRNSQPQLFTDRLGNQWWYWRRGRSTTATNLCAVQWVREIQGEGCKVNFLGPVLWISKREGENL